MVLCPQTSTCVCSSFIKATYGIRSSKSSLCKWAKQKFNPQVIINFNSSGLQFINYKGKQKKEAQHITIERGAWCQSNKELTTISIWANICHPAPVCFNSCLISYSKFGNKINNKSEQSDNSSSDQKIGDRHYTHNGMEQTLFNSIFSSQKMYAMKLVIFQNSSILVHNTDICI